MAGLIDELRNGISTRPALGPPGTPILRISAVRPGTVLLGDVRYLPRGDGLLNTYALRDRDILFTRYNGSLELLGVCGMVRGLNGTPLLYPDKLMRVRVKEQIVPEYIEMFFRSPAARDAIMGLSKSSAGQQGISGKDLKEQCVWIAPLPEQRRIVAHVEALLADVNKAKERLDRVPLILKRFRQSVLAAACWGELTKEWRESNQTVPWRDVRLGDLLREPLRNGHSAKQSADGKGVPTFSLSAFTNGDFSMANVKMTVADPAKVRDLWAEPDDIYVERSNTPELVGTARLYDGPRRHAIVPDLVIRVRLKQDAALPRFVEHCLRSKAGRDYFIDLAQGTAGSMPKIDQSAVMAFPIALPRPDEQAEIVRQVQKLFALADTIERRVQAATVRANKLPQAILSKAFSGELVPTEAELARAEGRTYETAEELLKRIAAAGSVVEPTVKKSKRARSS